MVLKAIAVIAILAVVAISISTFFGVAPGTEMRSFTSYAELKTFVEQNSGGSNSFGLGMESVGAARATSDMIADSSAPQAKSAKATDYSETNVQVAGVDEGDIVKNDGKYIYTISGNKILIIDAFPASNMNIISEIEVNTTVSQLYINGDKLIAFSGAYYGDKTKILIYDVTDRANPFLANTIEADGNYLNSRMIGDYVYSITNKYVRGADPVLPVLMEGGVERTIAPTDIYYYPYPDSGFTFNIITSINVQSSEVNSKVYMLGSSYTLYVSQNNIFLTGTKSINYIDMFERTVEEVYIPLLPPDKAGTMKVILDSDKSYSEKSTEIQKILMDFSDSLTGNAKSQMGERMMKLSEEFSIKIQKELQKTIIHKIGISGSEIDYKAVGEVPGRVLNQFSMDEYNGHFRIATTTGNTWESSGSLNHLYVLNGDMNIVGKVEDLAPGESIYSTRFMGAKAYIVTFRKIDPLFVIDLSNPSNPIVLGQLKITGYSNYLHPYDENHIIGIGKETAGGDERFSWYQGVKISLFDVSDVANPIEKAKIELGDRGTNSNALYDHKAFLFDKEKGIIVIPISISEIDESSYSGEIPDNAYGKFVWQGAIVLNIDTEGITERGRVTHNDNQTEMNQWGYYNNQDAVKRSLYMDDVLYTISNKKIKANDLITVDEINTLDLTYTQNSYPYPLYDR